jgi:two-component system, NarL family, nitrate/nitrite response regulator NarL
MSGSTRFPAGPARDLRALVATGDDRLLAWARERLPLAGVTVWDEAGDADNALRLAGDLRPDLCLVDVALPGGAMAVLHGIPDRAPASRIVMLAPSADDATLLPAVRAGASGCMLGTPEAPALKRALGDVLAGRMAMPRALVTDLVAGLGPA